MRIRDRAVQEINKQEPRNRILRGILMVALICLSTLLQWSLVFEFRISSDHQYLRPEFVTQVYILSCISLLCTYCSVFFDSPVVKGIFAVLRILSFSILSYAVGNDIWWASLQLAALLIDISIIIPSKISFFVSLFLVVMQVPLQKEAVVWENLKPAMMDDRLIFLVLFGCLISIVLTLGKLLLKVVQDYMIFKQHHVSMIGRISQTNLALQEYAIRTGETSKKLERKRIATDIHDTIGHTLVTIKMLVESAKIKIDSKNNVEKCLELIKVQSVTGLKDTRMALDDLNHNEEALKWTLNDIVRLIDIFRESTGVSVHYYFQNIPSQFQACASYVLYHLIQEGLTNSLVHGEAEHIVIQFWSSKDELHVQIKDDGKGCKEFHEGYGLSGMKKRVEGLNGKLLVDFALSGFVLHASFPLASCLVANSLSG